MRVDLPYGTGDFIIIWAFAVVARKAVMAVATDEEKFTMTVVGGLVVLVDVGKIVDG